VEPAVFERLGLRPSIMGELASEVLEEVARCRGRLAACQSGAETMPP